MLMSALYGNLDYYFFYTEKPADVIDEITHLTGRTLLKPKYALGFQQGCYGYNTRSKLETIAKAYRDHQIPCDGLHIDVDVQDQYQTFTTSEQHFPDIKDMFADLHAIGFKCATNITLQVCNINLQGPSKYPAVETGLQEDPFIYNTRDFRPPNPERFVGAIGYGNDPYGAQLIECEFDAIVSQKNAWSWDAENEVATVSFVDDKTNTSISII